MMESLPLILTNHPVITNVTNNRWRNKQETSSLNKPQIV